MGSGDRMVRIAAGFVLAVYVSLAVTWVFTIPLGGGIDEPRHLRYVQIVADEARLPAVAEKQEAISHHPPLHYLILAPVYLATRGLGKEAAWYALRLAQIPLGAVTLVLILAVLRRMVPDRPWLGGVGMASLGLLPHFQLLSATISNDVTTALFSTLMLYFVVRAVREPARLIWWAALAGLAGGLSVLTRTNALAIIPVALAAVVAIPLVFFRSDEDAQDALAADSRALRGALAFGGTFLVSGGLWLARHVLVWGGIDPDPPWPEYTWPVHTFSGKLIRAVDGLFRSWWAQVGWVPGPHSARPPGYSRLWPRPDLETPVFALAAIVTLIAAVGIVILLIRWLRDTDTRESGLALATFAGAWLLTTAAVVYNAMYVNPGRFEGGRYLFPALAAGMSLLVIGPLALPRRWTIVVWAATLALLATMTGISFWEMHTYLIPTFAK